VEGNARNIGSRTETRGGKTGESLRIHRSASTPRYGSDVWWHLNDDVAITSEWGTPSMIENGLNPDDLLGRKFGHHLNFWKLSEGRITQRIDLGDEHQMVLELRPAYDPRRRGASSA